MSSLDIIDLLKSFRNTLFIVDEAYIHFVSGDQDYHDLLLRKVDNHNNLIIVRTLSKAVSLAGLRTGYIIACPEIIERLTFIHNFKNITDLAQIALKYYTENYHEYLTYAYSIVKMRDNLIEWLKQLDIFIYIKKSNTNFILLQLSKSYENYLNHLLQDGIHVREIGPHNGCDNILIRVTIRSEMDMFKSSTLEFINSIKSLAK